MIVLGCEAVHIERRTSLMPAAAVAALPLDFPFERLASAAALALPWFDVEDSRLLASFSALCLASCASQCLVVPTRPLQACKNDNNKMETFKRSAEKIG